MGKVIFQVLSIRRQSHYKANKDPAHELVNSFIQYVLLAIQKPHNKQALASETMETILPFTDQ